jgi:hypothetical protein
VRGEEGDQRRLRVEAKSVIIEVDCVETRKVEDRSEKGTKGLRDFVEEPSGENIGEVCDLYFMVSPRR